jgi:hypothetical protein
MVFSNLFSSSFLFNIAIFILIGCILAYVNYKMTEQDHKLNSMIGLISTMAEEMHFFRSKLHNNNNNNMNDVPATDKFQFASQLLGGSELIEVSDNEYEEDLDEEDLDEDDLDEEDLDEEDLDEDDLDEDDLDEDDLDEDDLDENEMIQLSLENLNEPLENTDIVDLEDINNDFEQNKSIKTIHLEQTFDLEETNLISLNDNEIKEDNNFLKNINTNDLDEDSKTDYKKMSVNKLREIAINKGFADTSKLKKNDILKMLGEE